jgi:cytochrome b
MAMESEADDAGAFSAPAESGAGRRVWDPLVRLFHWSLVAAFLVAWATGDEENAIHIAAGYVIIALLAVRVVWGFVGTRHARFSDFVHRPATVVSFLADTVRLRAERYHGHNPAGGAMVIAMFVLLSAICGTGYMLTTDAYWGVHWVKEVHETLVNLMLVLIAVHLAGVILASLEHKENLVRAMVTGRKRH